MAVPDELKADQLYRRSDPNAFDFETTAELAEGVEIVGQDRAVESVRFAVGMTHRGYNLFAFGPPGTGKHFIVDHFLKQEAADGKVPPDLCYVYNFDEPQKPTLLELPAGLASELHDDMDEVFEEVSTSLPAAFESEEYQARLQAMQQEFKERHEKQVEDLDAKAKTKGLTMIQTQVGMVFAPIADGEVIAQEDFGKLPEAEQKRLESEVQQLQEELQSLLRKLPGWERELRARVREVNREVTDFALGQVIKELRVKYKELPEVVAYLDAVQHDLVENAREFMQSQQPQPPGLGGGSIEGSPIARRYRANVLVDHSETEGAPVVYEDHPIYENLFGRIEHISHMGTLVTDFNLIKPGSLHRASGGYLILEARRLLMQPYAWEGLKRALKSREIRIESTIQAMGLAGTVTLEPGPAPLDVKTVLLGDRMLYYLLCQHDPDFGGLFKVAADFDDRVERTDDNQVLYARLIGDLVRKHGLKPFDRGAVARVIEHGARQAGDSERMSGHIGALADLLRECDYWAGKENHDVVTAEGVQKSIDAQVYRVDRIREQMQEQVLRKTISIDTDGSRIGQINGLAVLQIGNFSFGKPSRITARVRLGKGEVIDIERKVELGGPIHSKGVLILSGFLGARYAADHPLALSASLVFEQSYGGVDGDSASSAELYALLSAIAGIPITQSLAVTGSVNQYGDVQAIGGANEKIEGFYDLCAERGLTGSQGVLIPASNVKHLMLRHDVVEAVRDGKFHVYPIETIDQGIEVLTGTRAGEPDPEGNYPADSINGRVRSRLREMARTQVSFAKSVARRSTETEDE